MGKKRILFFAEAVTLAHVARPLVLAQSLNSDHFEAHIACDSRFARLFPDLQLPLHSLSTIPSSRFVHSLSKGRPLYDTQTLRDYVRDDLEIIEKIRPELIIGDFRLSLAVSAPLSHIPYCSISNSYWSPYAKQKYTVPELPLTKILGVTAAQALFNLARPLAFALHTLPLNRVRKEHGLKPIGVDLRRIYTWADHTLYADIPELTPTYELPQNHHYIGPVNWSPGIPAHPSAR